MKWSRRQDQWPERAVERIQIEQQREKRMLKEWRQVKSSYGTTSSRITFTLKESQKEKTERKSLKIWEIMAENVPKKGEETDTRVQEAQSSLWEEPNRSLPRHVIIKIKSSGENLKNSKREKNKKTLLCTRELPLDYQLSFQQKLCRSEGSSKIYLKLWRKKLLTKNLYPARPPFRTEGKRKSFP